MGNCQAVDAAALVIQHPSGKLERLYWPVTANEVMKLNPGHYVSLIIPIPVTGEEKPDTVRFTRVKLLRPTDTLVLGRAYRLVTTQEVMKVLRAKRNAKTKKAASEGVEGGSETHGLSSEQENNHQDTRRERHPRRSGQHSLAAARSKSWRPSLQSISESLS